MRERRKRTGVMETADCDAHDRAFPVGDIPEDRRGAVSEAARLPRNREGVLAVDRRPRLGAANRDRGECIGKTGYLSWTAADKALRHMNVKPRKREEKLRPYRCRFCPHWHLGNGGKR